MLCEKASVTARKSVCSKPLMGRVHKEATTEYQKIR